ncbi:hypothetical protein GCM10025792_12140 [Pseudonocardia tropica]
MSGRWSPRGCAGVVDLRQTPGTVPAPRIPELSSRAIVHRVNESSGPFRETLPSRRRLAPVLEGRGAPFYEFAYRVSEFVAAAPWRPCRDGTGSPPRPQAGPHPPANSLTG